MKLGHCDKPNGWCRWGALFESWPKHHFFFFRGFSPCFQADMRRIPRLGHCLVSLTQSSFFALCPSSSILMKQDVSETGCASFFKLGKRITWWSRWVELFSVTGHRTSDVHQRTDLKEDFRNVLLHQISDHWQSRKEDYLSKPHTIVIALYICLVLSFRVF